jgi:hypothetical protein
MVADPHEPDDNPSLPPTESMADPPSHPASIGRYRVEGVIGKGGFGLVFLAHDDQLRRRVAIKVPHRELTSQPADAEAYLSEARALASLDHPHIVPVHDVGSTPDFPCFFVSKVRRRHEPSPASEAILAQLHGSGGIDGHRRRSVALRAQAGIGTPGHQAGQHPDRPQRQALSGRFRTGVEGSRVGQRPALSGERLPT